MLLPKEDLYSVFEIHTMEDEIAGCLRFVPLKLDLPEWYGNPVQTSRVSCVPP